MTYLDTVYEVRTRQEDRMREVRTLVQREKKELEEAVVKAYQEGASISALTRAYRTSARQVIIGILKEHGVYSNPGFYGVHRNGAITPPDEDNPRSISLNLGQ